jgi:MoaA/NifB/PqqE/SkfB family radical SAM enzyme
MYTDKTENNFKFEISVILPTLRPEKARVCIQRIIETSVDVNFEIVVVSPLNLKELLSGCVGYDRITFVSEDEKRGSCYANTLGWKNASGKYVFAIADDHMLGMHCLRNLIAFMRPHDNEIFLAGTRCYGVAGPGCEHTVYGIYYAYNPCIRNEVVARIGGFYDPYYKCYWGDPDLAMRVWHNGGKTALCLDAWVEFHNVIDTIDSESQEKYKERDYEAFVKRWHSLYGSRAKSSKFEDINFRNKGAYPGLPPEKCSRIFVFLQKRNWVALESELFYDSDVFLTRSFAPDVFDLLKNNLQFLPKMLKCRIVRWLCGQLYDSNGYKLLIDRVVSNEEKQWVFARIVSDIKAQHSANQNLADCNDVLHSISVFYASKEYVKCGPTLVIEGYRDINIIYFDRMFFSWPQEFGEFDRGALRHKKDPRIFYEDRIYKVIQRINEYFDDKKTVDWHSVKDCEEKSFYSYFIFSIIKFFITGSYVKGSPELVIEGYKGVNIIHFNHKYYAWHQRLGGFQVELFNISKDRFAFSDGNIYTVIQNIDKLSGGDPLVDWHIIQYYENMFAYSIKSGVMESIYDKLSDLTNNEMCFDVISFLRKKDWTGLEKLLDNSSKWYSDSSFLSIVYAEALGKLYEAPKIVLWKFCYWLALRMYVPNYGYKPVRRIPSDHIFPHIIDILENSGIPAEIQQIVEEEAKKVESLADESQEFNLYRYMRHYFAVFKEAGAFNPVLALKRKYFMSDSFGGLKRKLTQYMKLPEKKRANDSFLSMIKQKVFEFLSRSHNFSELVKCYLNSPGEYTQKSNVVSAPALDVNKYSISPPVLIAEGYRNYNILKCWDHYYGWHQSFGEFSLFAYEERKDSDILDGTSVLAVKSSIDKKLGTPSRSQEQILDWGLVSCNELHILKKECFDPETLRPIDDVLLVVQGYRQYNIVHCNGLYFGWPWSAGGFSLHKFNESGLGSAAVVAESILEVKMLIDLKLGSSSLEEQAKHDWSRINEIEAVCENKHKSINNIREQASVVDNLPTVMIVSTAVGCNIKCRMCYLQSEHELSYGGSFSRRSMSEEAFSRVQNLLPKLDTAIMTVEGEILLHRKWLDRWLQIVKQRRNLKLSFQSNGMLMDSKAVEMVLSNPTIEHIAFSVDGITPEVFESIRCGARMEQVFGNIAALAKQKEKRKLCYPNIHTHFVMQKDNIYQLPGYIEKMFELGVNSISARHIIVYHKEQIKDSLFFNQQLSDEMVDKARKVAQKHGRAVDLPMTFYEANRRNSTVRPLCYDPWRHGQILHNGGIYSCCNNAVLMGNILDDGGFESVWNNEKYQLLRKTVNSGDAVFSMCKYCNALMPVNCFEAHVYTKLLFGLLEKNELNKYCPKTVNLLIKKDEKLVE